MKKCEIKLCGVATVGPKGQIVIPKDIRVVLGIKSGDSFAVVLKDGKYIGLVRNQDMKDLMTYMKSEEK